MAIICGIEIKSKTACLMILEGSQQAFNIVNKEPIKIELGDSESQESLKSFSESIDHMFCKYNVEKVFVKAGVSKGKFTSGSAVFKIETIIQMSQLKVSLIKALTLKSFFKDKEPLEPKASIKKYQHVAFDVAYYGLETR